MTPIVAFDIDGTWSLSPSVWLEVFLLLKKRGYDCIIVTGAKQPEEKLRRLLIPEDAVIVYAENILKEEAARKAGYKVAIWIDDMPGMIQNCRILEDNL